MIESKVTLDEDLDSLCNFVSKIARARMCNFWNMQARHAVFGTKLRIDSKSSSRVTLDSILQALRACL
jgi:hypothetical protein